MMNICAIVPAGGRSERFGGGAKLAQDLGGRPVLIRTVEQLVRIDQVRSIVVAGPADDDADDPLAGYQGFVERFGPALGFHGAMVVRGGRTARWESVRAALNSVPDEATHIMVHDAARPITPDAVFERVIAAAGSFSAVIPVVEITATLRRVTAEAETISDDDGIADLILGEESRLTTACRLVGDPVDREGLCEVQTPQIFRADLLRRAYEAVDPAGVTDDAGIVQRAGEAVYSVEGDPRNIKLTTTADLELARAILGVPPPKERPAHLRF